MDPIITAKFPFLVEHTIWLPGALKALDAVAGPLESFFRDFDDHTMAQLEEHAPWLREAYGGACPDEDDYDEDEMAAGVLRAIGRGDATGWLVQIRVPTPPQDSWGSAWLIWAYGSTVQDGIARGLLKAQELREKERERS